MSRDIAAEMREFSGGIYAGAKPNLYVTAEAISKWASEVEVMHRHIAELETQAERDRARIEDLELENYRMRVVLNTVHGQDQEISRLRDEKIALEAQAERDRAVIEAARKVLDVFTRLPNGPEWAVAMLDLRNAFRLHDEGVNGHE